MKNLIVASTSTIHGSGYLEYLTEALTALFSETDEILFIPFARPGGISHDDYTDRVTSAFLKLGKKISGLHTYNDPVAALANAKGIFTGGGNTFVLVSQLLNYKCMQPLREALLTGTPYLGTSAGSNICGVTMQNTNDMPIVYPTSFKTTGVVPFNINAHYLDPDPHSTHMGESRETRIKEYHTQQTIPVVGLREGSWIRAQGEEMILKGTHSARIFLQGKTPFEVASETDIASVL